MDYPKTQTTPDTSRGRRQTRQQQQQNPQKTKMRSNTQRPKNWGEPMCSRRVNSSCFLLDINHATHIAKSDKVLSVTEKEQIYDKVLSVTEKEQIYDKVLSVTEKEQQSHVSDRERTTKSCQ